MQLHEFIIRVCRDDAFLQRQSVICFQGTTYPLLFFSLLSAYLQRQHRIMITSLDLEFYDIAVIKVHGAMSFLGNSSVYWLRNSVAASVSMQQELLAYSATYTGPNVLMFFVENSSAIKSNTSMLLVQVPEYADRELMRLICTLIDNRVSASDEQCITWISTHYQHVLLDTACGLMRYTKVLGKNSSYFFEHWVQYFIIPSTSLFALSQALLAKEGEKFMQLWHTIQDTYNQQFWVTFWSEQLWRACAFVHLARTNKWVDAKKIGNKLPFSFTQRDWKKYSVAELCSAHNYVYIIDYDLKHSRSEGAFDVLYTKFFLNGFA